MKRLFVFMLAAMLVFSGRRAEADARRGEAAFADLWGHWANGFVAEAVAQGLVRGYPDGTFRPEEAVTPLELKVMLARLLRRGTPPADQVDAVFRSAGIDPTLPDLGAPARSAWARPSSCSTEPCRPRSTPASLVTGGAYPAP